MNNESLKGLSQKQILTTFRNQFNREFKKDVKQVNIYYLFTEDNYVFELEFVDGSPKEKRIPDRSERKTLDFIIKRRLTKLAKKQINDINIFIAFGAFLDLVNEEINVTVEYKDFTNQIKNELL